MKAALDVLDKISANRKITVLGNIFEMGDFAERGHRSVGAHLVNKKIDLLVTVGEMAHWIALEAEEKGFKKENIFAVSTNKEAINILKKNVQDGDAILVKGSRGMVMEEIVMFYKRGDN